MACSGLVRVDRQRTAARSRGRALMQLARAGSPGRLCSAMTLIFMTVVCLVVLSSM